MFAYSDFLILKVQIQLLFIADLRHKKMKLAASEAAGGRFQSAVKPGRQIVTFLLVCNLGLWITYNFEMQKVGKSCMLSTERIIIMNRKYFILLK